MRILITADAAGGVGVLAAELAHALLARGHQVLVVVFSPTQPALLPGLHCLWAPFRLEWMDVDGDAEPLATDSDAGRAYLADLASHWRPDVLHSNHFAFVGAVPRIPTLLAVHSDVVSWWRTVRNSAPPSNPYQRWYAATARQGLEGAAAVISPSQSARRDLLSSFSPNCAVRVIVNGRDPASFPLAPKRPLALAVGRFWDEAKQLSVLKALDGAGGLELAVAGALCHPLRPGIRAAPAAARVLGQLPPADLRGWMARALVFIGTSVYEPFGLAVLEAALSGCLLLLNDIAAWRELWGPVACFYTSTAELRDLLRRAAADSAWACARGEAARRHARRRFTASRMAAAYEAAYQRLRVTRPPLAGAALP